MRVCRCGFVKRCRMVENEVIVRLHTYQNEEISPIEELLGWNNGVVATVVATFTAGLSFVKCIGVTTLFLL